MMRKSSWDLMLQVGRGVMMLLQSQKAVDEGDESASEKDFGVTEGAVGEKEDMVVKGIDRWVKVVAERMDYFGFEGKERAGGQDGKGKKCGIDGDVEVVVQKVVTFSSDDGLRVARRWSISGDERSL